MKIINLNETVFRPGEFIVGADQTGSHACYLLYGILKPGETRALSPGHGHEEIFCCLEGEVIAKADSDENPVKKGQCFHMKGEDSLSISNECPNPVVYVLAGGHSDSSHHGERAHHSGHGHSD